jgi:hypothetical protein
MQYKSYGARVFQIMFYMKLFHGVIYASDYYVSSRPSNEVHAKTLRKTDTTAEHRTAPREFAVSQNYPNPFNPTTIIKYYLLYTTCVKLIIYDLLGRQICTLVDGEITSGEKTVPWNRKNSAGQTIGSGVYFYRLQGGSGFVSTKKLVFLN